MTITQLHYVLAVAEYQNFTIAAKKIAVTQPTLSMQIRKLEEELSVEIFDRQKSPIGLTTAGKGIVEQAGHIIEESERIQDIVDQEKGFIGGTFKIGIIPTVMPTLLPLFLKTLVRRYPEIKLKIEELNTEALIEGLKEGHLDAGIAATPLSNENIQERTLYYEPFVGYIPENHRLAHTEELVAEELDVNDILLLQDGHCFKENVLNLCKARENQGDIQFELQSGSFETLINLCNEGLGMTLLPYLHSRNLLKEQQEKLHFFKNPAPAREISLIHSKNDLKIHIIKAIEKVIVGIIKGAIAFEDVKIISPLKKY